MNNPKQRLRGNFSQICEVVGAWGYSNDLQPAIIEHSKYKELLDVLYYWNETPPDVHGIIAGAVAFRSANGGYFLLGSARGDAIMTGTLIGNFPKFDNEKWIWDRGKNWNVYTKSENSSVLISVIDGSRYVSSSSCWLRPVQRLFGLHAQREYSGTIHNSLVIPVLTHFFSMSLNLESQAPA